MIPSNDEPMGRTTSDFLNSTRSVLDQNKVLKNKRNFILRPCPKGNTVTCTITKEKLKSGWGGPCEEYQCFLSLPPYMMVRNRGFGIIIVTFAIVATRPKYYLYVGLVVDQGLNVFNLYHPLVNCKGSFADDSLEISWIYKHNL